MYIINSVRFQLNTVWVSCEGENPADIENVGPIQYFPRRGFPGYFYPFENSEGYLSPLVAVHLERPTRKFKNHLDITIENSDYVFVHNYKTCGASKRNKNLFLSVIDKDIMYVNNIAFNVHLSLSL